MGDGRYKVQTTGESPAVFAKLTEALSEAVMTMRRGSQPRAVLVFGAACLSVVVAGCTSDPGPSLSSSSNSPSPASPSSSGTSADPAVAAASQAALSSYSAFWKAKVASQAQPTKKPPAELSKYAIDKALADALATVLVLRRNGVAMKGQPTHDASVASVTLGSTPTVQIHDCLDSSAWSPIFVATGKSALAPGQAPRVVVDSTATTFDGRWVIRTSVAHRDEPC